MSLLPYYCSLSIHLPAGRTTTGAAAVFILTKIHSRLLIGTYYFWTAPQNTLGLTHSFVWSGGTRGRESVTRRRRGQQGPLWCNQYGGESACRPVALTHSRLYCRYCCLRSSKCLSVVEALNRPLRFIWLHSSSLASVLRARARPNWLQEWCLMLSLCSWQSVSLSPCTLRQTLSSPAKSLTELVVV